jgi:NTP pyrophosphatase (non-canonical NTP hydrolase)
MGGMKYYGFNQYHIDTEVTRPKDTVHNTIGYALMGLIGELGEVVENFTLDPQTDEEKAMYAKLRDFQILASEIEALKKHIRKQQAITFPAAQHTLHETVEELGGVYWYLNNLADLAGTSMVDVAQSNAEMLQRRFSNNPGWMTNGGVKTH